MFQYIQRIDLFLLHIINGWCGNWTLDRVAAFEEQNLFFKGGVILIVFWWFWFAGPEKRRAFNRQRIIAILCGVVIGLIATRALATVLPFRMRPMYVPGIGYHPPSIPLLTNLEHWSSFPSDTAALFVGLAFGIFLLSRVMGALLMVYAAVWACLPRLYLGIHYPSDLVAGALIGMATVWLSVWILEAREGALGRRVMAPITALERRHPQVFYAAAFALSFEVAVIFDDLRHLVRGVVHLARIAGFSALGEGAALFLIGGFLVALAAAAYALSSVWRRKQPPRLVERQRGLPLTNPPGSPPGRNRSGSGRPRRA